MPLKFKTPRDRSPFFMINGEVFVDLLHYWGDSFVVEPEKIVEFLAEAPSDRIIIARRLDGREREEVLHELQDGQVDVYARFIKNDDVRWKVRRRGK